MKSFKSFIDTLKENYDSRLEEAHARLDEHHSRNFTNDQNGRHWDQMRNIVPYANHSPRVNFDHIDHYDKLPLQNVPVKSLKSAQHEVSYDIVGKKLRGEIKDEAPEHPVVVHHEGTHYVFDGNHRASVAIIRGDKTMKAYVYHAPKGTVLGENRNQKSVHPDVLKD